MHGTLRQLLAGAYDDGSPLSTLQGHSDLLCHIWTLVRRDWAMEAFLADLSARSSMDERDKAFAHMCSVDFPPPADRNVNMMPFMMNDLHSLPEDLRAYGAMIHECISTLSEGEEDRVGYLTVHESVVSKAESQRRPGLHTDGFVREPHDKALILKDPFWHAWGFGEVLRPGVVSGGIFMASTVSDSCLLYDVLVPNELIGPGGDVEHLRDTLAKAFPNAARPRFVNVHSSHPDRGYGRSAFPATIDYDYAAHECKKVQHPISIQKGQLFWVTDRTPHESLPLKEKQYRQYFRLVTSRISVWYEAHSTPNPLGVQPAAPIVTYNKFLGPPSSALKARASANEQADNETAEVRTPRASTIVEAVSTLAI
ncbi:hypothetical protein AB1Y20_022428 [Prymnesium parvum]|uniref:Uncharacterized protein n=1 Tax=Prymnesium parvum TaxID=97485 RepID=A0AB34JJD1_PRYPA